MLPIPTEKSIARKSVHRLSDPWIIELRFPLFQKWRMQQSHFGTGMKDVRQTDGHHLMCMLDSRFSHLEEYMVRGRRPHTLDGKESLTTGRDS